MEDTALKGYGYFTLGNYNGKPIQWVIIGYNSSTTLITDFFVQTLESWYGNGGSEIASYLYENADPAGQAIYSNSFGQPIMQSIFAEATFAIENTQELNPGEFLVLASENIFSTQFNVSNTGNTYDWSNLKTKIDDLYLKDLNLTEEEQQLIQPKDISTYSLDTTARTINDAYLFPLATTSRSTSQSFCVENYLPDKTLRSISAKWWLRSGQLTYTLYAYSVDANGVVITGNQAQTTSTQGVRPAMVVKLT